MQSSAQWWLSSFVYDAIPGRDGAVVVIVGLEQAYYDDMAYYDDKVSKSNCVPVLDKILEVFQVLCLFRMFQVFCTMFEGSGWKLCVGYPEKLAKLGDAIASHLKLSLTDPPTDRGNS